MKSIPIIFALLCCTLPAFGAVSSSTFTDGGSVISHSDSMWTTSTDLNEFLSQDVYQHGSLTSRVVSMGRTGLAQTTELDQSRSNTQSTTAETTGRMTVSEAGGIWGTQTNVSPLDCESVNMVTQEGDDISRLPETQDATVFIGMMGAGAGTRYESDISVDEMRLEMDSGMETGLGFAYMDAWGEFDGGLDVNDTALQYRYEHRDHVWAFSGENKSLSAKFEWLWDMDIDEVAGENQ